MVAGGPATLRRPHGGEDGPFKSGAPSSQLARHVQDAAVKLPSISSFEHKWYAEPYPFVHDFALHCRCDDEEQRTAGIVLNNSRVILALRPHFQHCHQSTLNVAHCSPALLACANRWVNHHC